MRYIGIDEVGRGAWAGPLLVVAVRGRNPVGLGLKDSKQTSKSDRLKQKLQIESIFDIGEGWVSADEIDKNGLSTAMKLGVARSLEAIKAAVDEDIIVDGNVNYCSERFKKSKAIIKADATYPLVSAASIYAKVTRDEYMSTLANDFPEYNFDSHVGYGTKAHIAALKQHGVCIHHRKTYKPIRKILDE